MLRNIKLYLENDLGLSIYDMISLVFFAFVMIFALTYALGLPKQHIDELKNFPLNDQNDLDYGKKE